MPLEGPLNFQYARETPLVRLISWIIHLIPRVNISSQIIRYRIEKEQSYPRTIPQGVYDFITHQIHNPKNKGIH